MQPVQRHDDPHTMTPEPLAELFAHYEQLPPEQQAVMNVLAVYYGYATPTLIGKCLFYLGFKDKKGREPKSATVLPYLEALQALRLVEKDPKQGAYRCPRRFIELLTRKLAEDKRAFEKVALSIEKHAPVRGGYYRYSKVDDCLREARMQFHRRDYAKANECLKVGRYTLHLPDTFDIYLLWILNPLDSGWLQNRHPVIYNDIAGYIGLHQLMHLHADPSVDDFLRQCALRPGITKLPLATRTYAELQLLRGEWDELQGWIGGREEAELQAVAAALTFLNGDTAQALGQFEQALAALRKTTGKRTSYFLGLSGLIYPLAILKEKDSKQLAKLDTLLAQAVKANGLWTEIYRYFALFQQFQQGELQRRAELLSIAIPYKISSGFTEDGLPEATIVRPSLLQHVFLLLIKFWVDSAHFSRVTPDHKRLYHHLHDNGYRWPAAELAKLFAKINPYEAKNWDAGFLTERPVALAELFESRPDWDLALDALLNITPQGAKSAEQPAAADKPARLIWLVSYHDASHTLKIEPREQRQQAKGGWSKGRTVALKRLHAERESFDYLSEQDLKLCKTIKEYRDSSWYGATYFDFGGRMPIELVGHPLLFWADSPEVRVEVVRGEAELRVSKLDNSDKIRIKLQPAPGVEQKIHISKETPTRLRVVEFTTEHQKIYSVLGPKGLEVPLSAQQRVLQTLTGISGLLTVQSDIGGSSSTAEQVKADATPRLHLLPLGEGLKAALLIRPFATDGAYYVPGQGGESVLAEIDGRRVQARRDLKLERQRAAELFDACPALAQAVQDEAGEWLLEDPEQCLELLLQLQALPEGQTIVEWPEGVKFRLLGQAGSSAFSMHIKRDNDWFALQGELKINDATVIEMQELLALLGNSKGRFLRLRDGQFVALTDAFRRRLEDLKAYADISGRKVRLNPLAALTLEDWGEDGGTFKADKHWQEQVRRLKSAREFQPVLPSTFQAELRDYQMDGYAWLARLAEWGVGACLADDMGLGKTIQGLALLVERAPNGPSLIVAPTSVCMNWEIEANRFAPTLNPQQLGGGDRQRQLDRLGPYDLLICSYGLLQQEQVAEMLAKISFQTVILDEAQAIKNTATRRSQGAMNLQGDFRIIMTGTPLENHLGELWNLFRFINPGLLGSQEQFNQRFAGPIERDRSHQARQQLKKLIQPFILRRTKTQVLQELPPRTEIPVYVELSPDEMAFYEAIRRESLNALASTDGPPGQKHLQILAAITKLRRSCCNSRLANAEISLPSSKLAAFGEIVEELLDNKHKALVFSQFVDHLQIIKDYVEQRGIAYQYLDGSTPAKERQQRVDAFQRGDGELFLISLKAGGVGLNLTAADYVIHMDPWWNPAVEDQASDRAHRMGQQRPVTIYRMIAKQTIEEKIVALHSHKRDLADSLLDGADISGKMSADDLLGLMRGDA
ncbi:DEAD/DEAH box helicase [Methylomicrobium sp. Wu6]|uniref:DEAD/DEAH box helicase n=1 Tax=Methylomicrobium sp. Wu6 TaxID=3107928 RepID=UPI002DD69159|nr:DEAD/DEAH box helicase [Methylomicrobium sp. Wu6]MEC4750515.1 DEAD/DEAH box helicase [Methylomicrobium sp. Wu6]